MSGLPAPCLSCRLVWLSGYGDRSQAPGAGSQEARGIWTTGRAQGPLGNFLLCTPEGATQGPSGPVQAGQREDLPNREKSFCFWTRGSAVIQFPK